MVQDRYINFILAVNISITNHVGRFRPHYWNLGAEKESLFVIVPH